MYLIARKGLKFFHPKHIVLAYECGTIFKSMPTDAELSNRLFDAEDESVYKITVIAKAVK